MKKNIILVFFIIGLSFTFGFIKQVVLARLLSKENWGLFSLFMSIIAFVYPIALLGKQNSIVRLFSGKDIQSYSWKAELNKIFIISFFISLILLTFPYYIYNLNVLHFLFIFVSVTGSITGDLFSSVFRSQGKYEISILLNRCIRFFFPLLLLLLFYFNDINLNSVLFSFSFLYLIFIIFIIYLTYKSYKEGSKKVSSRVHTDGLLFLGSDISLLIIIYFDKLIVAKLLSIEDLAIFFSIFAITRIYELAVQTIEYVLMPHAKKLKSLKLKKMTGYAFILILAITLFYIILGPFLVKFLYANKYDAGIELIPYFCIVGTLRILFAIPNSIIGGRLGSKALKRLLISNVSLILVNIIISFIFILQYGLIGAVTATALIWLLRCIGAYSILYKFRYSNA